MGAGLITTLTWAVNGLLAGGPAPSQAATGGHTTADRHPARHQHHTAPTPAPSPSATASRPPAVHRHKHRSRPALVSGSTPACAPGGITLTVSTQAWYQPGTTPRFTVHAVSTESQPCHFNMSPSAVAVVIETTGGRSVWNSADCASGPASHPVVLTSGTRAALHVSWDRRAGCGDAGNLVLPGEYRATAAAGPDKSASVNFVLGAKGSTGP